MKLHSILADEVQLEDKAHFWDCITLHRGECCSLNLPVFLWGGEEGEDQLDKSQLL